MFTPGPTAFGAIPGFTAHIFPQDGLPFLSLVANIGLCLFLFLVGLEIETATIKQNARFSAAIALAGIAIPFGFGAALAVPIYNQFIGNDVVFTHFMLFTGVAFCITAFPVLCRILTELKLLDTTVGVIVLSAGVGNDIVGWILLALSVALVNAGSGLTALYILLVCVGWTFVMLFPVRWIFAILARKTGSLENGPTVFFMTITILTLFGSAFFTDVIGVHAIFGAFLTGLVVPREGGMTIALTEKLEDMVGIIFLPLVRAVRVMRLDYADCILPPVFYVIRSFHQSTSARHGFDLGLRRGYLLASLCWEVWRLHCGRALCWLWMARVFHHRCAHELQRVRQSRSSVKSSFNLRCSLIELIVLNVGLSAGILTPVSCSVPS